MSDLDNWRSDAAQILGRARSLRPDAATDGAIASAAPIRQAAILVGGRGTRLGALTDAVPKPLAEVAGRPFLDWQIEEVARFGFERITLLAGYKAEQIEARYGGCNIRGARIETLVEPAPLGTAGALALFADRLDPRFLLMNGDTLFPINLLDLGLDAREALATLALARTAPGGRYGAVDVDADGAIHGFRPRSPQSAGPINGGVYVIDRAILQAIPPGRSVSLEAEVFPHLAAKGRIRGAIYDAPFLDIGIPEDLARAQTEIPEMVRRPAAFLDLDGDPSDPAKTPWTSGAAAAVKRLNDAGYYVFVITNRAGAARDSLSQNRIADALATSGAHVDRFESHRPEAPLAPGDRPAPALIGNLLAEWPVDVGRSFWVGGKAADLAALLAGRP